MPSQTTRFKNNKSLLIIDNIDDKQELEQIGNIIYAMDDVTEWTVKSDQSWVEVNISDSNGTTYDNRFALSATGTGNRYVDLRVNYKNSVTTLGYYQAKVTVTDTVGNSDVILVNLTIVKNGKSNLELTALEVTQGMQNLLNEMPLVQDRPTFVRAHVRATEKFTVVEKVKAKLTVKRPTGEILGTLSPINNAAGAINISSEAQRENLNDSFLFQMNPEWLNGKIILQFAGDGCDISIASDAHLPTQDNPLAFQKVPALPIHFLLGTQTYGSVTYLTDQTVITSFVSLIKMCFPIPNVEWTSEIWTRSYQVLDRPSREKALSDVREKWKADGSPKRHYVALFEINEPSSQGGGLADLFNPVSVFSGKKQVFETASITNHELEHNFGYGHTAEEGPTKYPKYVESQLSEQMEGPKAFYGFVIDVNPFIQDGRLSLPYADRVIPPSTYNDGDFISYGMWISDYIYKNLMKQIQDRYSTTPTSEWPPKVGDYIYIFVESQTIKFGHWMRSKVLTINDAELAIETPKDYFGHVTKDGISTMSISILMQKRELGLAMTEAEAQSQQINA